ncbi:hypothetical protein [Caballeronia catudaia]|uniref:hypothetical protein n=1 Tax=Caballeronia catudaia TaxID=1777136 RepID=UPI00190EC575|nr:hypothetical protein [Caballeronia catudaia]
MERPESAPSSLSPPAEHCKATLIQSVTGLSLFLANQRAVGYGRESMLATFPNKSGIAKRTLEEKFAAAHRSLDAASFTMPSKFVDLDVSLSVIGCVLPVLSYAGNLIDSVSISIQESK